MIITESDDEDYNQCCIVQAISSLKKVIKRQYKLGSMVKLLDIKDIQATEATIQVLTNILYFTNSST